MQEDEGRERIAQVLPPARPRRSAYSAWLDAHDAPPPPESRSDLQSGNDLRAEEVVADGGGIQAIIDATGLRTLENVERLIDPVILAAARGNEGL